MRCLEMSTAIVEKPGWFELHAFKRIGTYRRARLMRQHGRCSDEMATTLPPYRYSDEMKASCGFHGTVLCCALLCMPTPLVCMHAFLQDDTQLKSSQSVIQPDAQTEKQEEREPLPLLAMGIASPAKTAKTD